MDIDGVLESQIGRIVAFVVTPPLLAGTGMAAVWLQDALGVDMDPTQVTGFLVSVVVGLALVIYKWLSNRGKFETVALEVQKLYEAGHAMDVDVKYDPTVTESGDDPRMPPGLEQ